MAKFTLFILLGIMTSSTSFAAENLVWQCKVGESEIEIYTQGAVQFGRWGTPRFTTGQPLEVAIKSSDSELRGVHSGQVISQEERGVSKHAPMAFYSVKMAGLAKNLQLVLLGVDEFHDRHKCKWAE